MVETEIPEISRACVALLVAILKWFARDSVEVEDDCHSSQRSYLVRGSNRHGISC